MKTLPFLLLCIAMVASTASADERPVLPLTRLFTERALGCSDVELSSWKHQVRSVLETPDVVLRGVKLCNGGKYPVFFVEFRYDPTGDTKEYYKRLYAKALKANGYWPFSFVALSDQVVISIEPGPEKIARQIDLQQYTLE